MAHALMCVTLQGDGCGSDLLGESDRVRIAAGREFPLAFLGKLTQGGYASRCSFRLSNTVCAFFLVRTPGFCHRMCQCRRRRGTCQLVFLGRVYLFGPLHRKMVCVLVSANP